MSAVRKTCWVFNLVGSGWVDRLNSCVTVILLLSAAATVTIAPVFTRRIACQMPAHFSGTWVTYAHEVCWDSRQHVIMPEISENSRGLADRSTHSAHHHYLGLLFFGQAIMYFVLQPIWLAIQVISGVGLSDITTAAIDGSHFDPFFRDRSIRYLVKQCLITGKGFNSSIILSHLFIKFLYFLNSVLQIIFINSFVGLHSFSSYGFRVIAEAMAFGASDNYNRQLMEQARAQAEQFNITYTEETEPSFVTRFPSRIICDYRVMHLREMQTYSIQCIMPISKLYESVYAAIWIWIWLVCLVNLIHGVHWAIVMLIPSLKDRYITNRLSLTGKVELGGRAFVDSQFYRQTLGGDAYALIRHIGWTGSDVCAAEVVAGLWEEHKGNSRSHQTQGAIVHQGQTGHPTHATTSQQTGGLYPQASGYQRVPGDEKPGAPPIYPDISDTNC